MVARRLGWDMNRQKKMRFGRTLCLRWPPFDGGTQHQPNVGITVGGALKRRGDRGGTREGVLSLCLERQIDKEKKWQRKYALPLDGCRPMKIKQQPTKSMPAQQRRWRRTSRGARGKRESIVWGQSSWVVHQNNIKLMCLLKKNISLPDHRVNKKTLHPTLGQPLTKRVPWGHWLITHGHAAWASERLHHCEACFRCLWGCFTFKPYYSYVKLISLF